MSTLTLRQLAKDYARGAIDKDKYRKSRTELINGIVSGKISVDKIAYAPPLIPVNDDEDTTETVQREKRTDIKTEIRPEAIKTPSASSSIQAATDKTDNNGKSPMLFIGISAAIVVVLIIVVVLFYPKPPGTNETQTVQSTATTSTTNTTGPAASKTETESMAGETLLANFLSAKNWSNESLDEFVTSWSALTQEERDTASQTNRMRRMNNSIYQQFTEQQALATIDSEKALMTQKKLIEFAEAIGISDARLVIE